MKDDLISRSALFKNKCIIVRGEDGEIVAQQMIEIIRNAPAVNAYTAHEVAEIIADILGDPCACNFNGIDEWLPFKCELLDACPNPCGVACWEQYLKYRHCKNEMEAKEDGK